MPRSSVRSYKFVYLFDRALHSFFFIRIYFIRISMLKLSKFYEYFKNKPEAEILKRI